MHTILSNVWYYILALVWAVYISQELFVTGCGMISLFFKVDSKEYKQINESVGTHWDGIQVWLIVAIGGLFAVFYDAYASILEILYIPIFLLLFSIIFRGLSIELIYKSDDKVWQEALRKIWAVSSFLLIFIIGVYLTNLFMGLPVEDGMLTTSFLVIFSKVGILGGVLFVCSAISLAYLWIKLSCNKEYFNNKKTFFTVIVVVMLVVLVLMYLGFNHKSNGFIEGLFVDYLILWSLPVLSIVCGITATITFIKDKYVVSFISLILMIILFIFTGFSLTFPYILYSTIDTSHGLLITEASAELYALKLMTISAAIFVPIVIIYQSWKYIRFWRK